MGGKVRKRFLQAAVVGMFPLSNNARGKLLEDNEGGMFQSIRFWQGWAVFATVAALFAFIANAEFSLDGHTPDYVALLGDDGAPAWVVNADLKDGTLHVRAAGAKPPTGEQRYVLWLVGVNPQRLGELPLHREHAALALSGTATAMLAHGKTLGVAVESVGEGEAGEPPSSWKWQANIARL